MIQPKRVIVLSDLHCGSTCGLLPPEFVTSNEVIVKPNLFQAWMWCHWEKMVERFVTTSKKTPTVLILNGDIIEGMHHRTTEVWSPDPSDHLMCAWHCLARLADACCEVYIVRGTETHTGSASEHGLAHKLGACFESKHKPAWDRLDLSINGVQIRAVHHMPATSRKWLEAGAHSAEWVNHAIESAQAGDPIPRILCMAHRHRPGAFTDGHYQTIVTPAWQGLTRYGYRVVPGANPKVGYAEMDFSGAFGELPSTRVVVHQWSDTR
jgi:hypothetical protein